MAEPIRVAHVIGKMIGGGVEQVVMNYYRHISRSCVQFDFLVDSDSTLVPRDEIESLGGRVFEIPPYQSLVAYMQALYRLFCAERWPIVHSHVNALSAFSLSAAKRAGVPVRIAHGHSTAGRGEPLRNLAKATLRRFSNLYPTHRLACSRCAGEWLFGKEADFKILYNAIDLSKFVFDEDIREAVRADLTISSGQLAIGHVGRFEPQKNHRFLIDVFANVAKYRDDAVLIMVGSGGGRRSIENRLVELGIADRVRLLGQRDDVDRLYQAFDVFVLPSLYEGLGLAAIEAQAAGLPCILSERITREVNVTGLARFLPISDPAIWVDSLNSMAPGGRIAIRREDFCDYDIDSAAQRLADFYLQALSDVGAGEREDEQL